MPVVHVRSLDSPDDSVSFGEKGDAQFATIGDTMVIRSVLEPGWSWDEFVKPDAGTPSCPLDHTEYVISGRIRYLMDDGSEYEGKTGDFLVIEPGHRAFVDGDETCVLLDWVTGVEE
jgi:hypothetical protein